MGNYLNAYTNKTILVTGGADAIGSNLTRAWPNWAPRSSSWTTFPPACAGTSPPWEDGTRRLRAYRETQANRRHPRHAFKAALP
jgi:hypothetical protein